MPNTEQLNPAMVALLLLAASQEETHRARLHEAVVRLRIARESQRALSRLSDVEIRKGQIYRESKGW